MRVLHTADWHLGKLFHGIHLTEDQARLLEEEFFPLVRDLRPDLVVIAGDIFDRPVPPGEAVALLGEVLARLAETGATLLVIPGNHDSPERLSFARELLARVRVFVVADERYLRRPLLLLGGPPLYVAPHLSPFRLREFLASFGEGDLPESPRGLWERLLSRLSPGGIFVGHLFVEGGQAGESEARLWVGGEEAVPARAFEKLDLVLLGHLHRPQRPAENIYYAGSLLPLSFSEAEDQKGVWFFEMDERGRPGHREFLPLCPPRPFRVLRGRFEELLSGPREEAYLKIVLEDSGPIPQAFERLKERYPYLLALEFAPENSSSGPLRPPPSPESLSEEELFGKFLQEVAGRPPSEEERTAFREVLKRLGPAFL
ncbi:exonuclease SbcCD subunit D [Thermosulfurimonas marina]|uniref:exonuclease SbcCD subunit D n=1 Tax=Thermosulfurimonas marina TaxID=2047767 RepID=UPI00144AEF2E|nr:exonuclease SbcCD subunit D [Thermosulfurimonas marina]